MIGSVPYLPESQLSLYLRQINRFPLLDADVEENFARRYRDLGDDEAGWRLANSYLRLVVKIAKRYSGYGLPLSDIISEGNVGLMQAIQRFDPDQGYRLSTYAPWWIRAAIQEFVLRSESMVRMGTTAAQKKLFFNLRRLKAAHEQLDDRDLPSETVTAIASRLGVHEAEVIEMNRRLVGGTCSLNALTHDGADTEFQDLLEDGGDNQETVLADAQELAQRRQMLGEAIKILNDRERDILTARRLTEEPPTLEVLGRRYGISRERVRQIEVQALEKIRKAIGHSNNLNGVDKLAA